MEEKIREMTEDGFAAKRIATILKLKFNDVKNIIITNNYKIKPVEFDDNEIDHIIALYDQGVSAKNLGIKYSIDKRRVQRWVRQRGIERTRSESHRFTFFNENYFDKIDSPSKAYWLGFFYADAYNCQQVNTVHVTLSHKDKDQLVKLSKAVDLSSKKITTYDSVVNNKRYPTTCLKLYSKHMCDALARKGCPQAKSFIIKYPMWLSHNLNNHFIRGLFDGDGCLTKRTANNEWKWSLVSTKKCCEEIQKIIADQLNLEISYHCISKDNKNTYELETSGNEKIHKIMKWLYEDSTDSIRLSRKFIKYEELVNQQNNRNIKRDSYLLSEETKHEIINSNQLTKDIANLHGVHPKTVLELKNNSTEFSTIVSVNGQPITAKFIKNLSKSEREKYVDPLFDHFRRQGWVYPSVSDNVLKKTWKKLCSHEPDLSVPEVFNNGSLGTNICKHFCKSFCHASERNKPNMIELWKDDAFLKELIKNRLVISWHSKVNETFNISHRMMIQGMRSMRAVPSTTMFKPAVAKYICMKYSSPGDLVGDYSAGFGGRMLGATSCNRRYLGIDPLTTPELIKMKDYFGLDAELILSGSEYFKGQENSLDLCWSSPPYYDQEYYSDEISQAYNRGEEYFYNIYWRNTLLNMRYMLKPGKWFGLNVKNCPKMLDMAQNLFGQEIEKIGLRTIRSHLNKSAGIKKYEYVYMFINNK